MMSFAFNFSGDDIDELDNSDGPKDEDHDVIMADESERHSPAVKARKEDMFALLSSLPSRISYSTLPIRSPKRKQQVNIPRRELFDVRMQLMAEDGENSDGEEGKGEEEKDKMPKRNSSPNGNSRTTNSENGQRKLGLGDSDIEQNVYEGGFKSWEGALDLAQLLLDQEIAKSPDKTRTFQRHSVLELGCGTAIPTLVLFDHVLSVAASSNTPLAVNFTLADYNASVLRLVTIPNLLLTWAVHPSNSQLLLETMSSSSSPSPDSPASSASSPLASGSESHPSDSPDTQSHGRGPNEADKVNKGDLKVSPALLKAFASDLTRRGISITVISGSWADSPHFTSLLQPHVDLILAAETIYSPLALSTFTATLLDILADNHGRQVPRDEKRRSTVAFVAAKRVYFGVGGGVDEFVSLVEQSSSVEHPFAVREILGSGIVGCDREVRVATGGSGNSGVGRWLGEVFLS